MSACPAPLDANCPHRLLLDQVTDKWSILILTTFSPGAVEYRITPLGRTVLPPVLALYAWTVESLPEVEQSRRRFDERGDRDSLAA